MVSTFGWIEANATAGDTGTPTNLNLGSTNARDLAPSTYPIAAGSYSYSKWVRGYWSGAFTRVDNIKFWMSNSETGYVSGEALLCSASTGSYAGTSTYVTPTNGLDAQADHAMTTAEPARNVGVNGSLATSLTTSGFSDFIIVQASITAAAAAGAVQQKTFTIQWDEI